MPAFLPGVWNFGMGLAEGAYLTSPRYKPWEHWVSGEFPWLTTFHRYYHNSSLGEVRGKSLGFPLDFPPCAFSFAGFALYLLRSVAKGMTVCQVLWILRVNHWTWGWSRGSRYIWSSVILVCLTESRTRTSGWWLVWDILLIIWAKILPLKLSSVVKQAALVK